MVHRRSLKGRALLVASAVVVTGCSGGGAVGNLVAPPMVELCVTVEPAEAEVAVDGAPLDADGCNTVYEGEHTVTATADGYAPYEEQVEVTGDTDHDITMTAAR